MSLTTLRIKEIDAVIQRIVGFFISRPTVVVVEEKEASAVFARIEECVGAKRATHVVKSDAPVHISLNLISKWKLSVSDVLVISANLFHFLPVLGVELRHKASMVDYIFLTEDATIDRIVNTFSEIITSPNKEYVGGPHLFKAIAAEKLKAKQAKAKTTADAARDLLSTKDQVDYYRKNAEVLSEKLKMANNAINSTEQKMEALQTHVDYFRRDAQHQNQRAREAEAAIQKHVEANTYLLESLQRANAELLELRAQVASKSLSPSARMRANVPVGPDVVAMTGQDLENIFKYMESLEDVVNDVSSTLDPQVLENIAKRGQQCVDDSRPQ